MFGFRSIPYPVSMRHLGLNLSHDLGHPERNLGWIKTIVHSVWIITAERSIEPSSYWGRNLKPELPWNLGDIQGKDSCIEPDHGDFAIPTIFFKF